MYSSIALDISIRFILEGNVEVIIALMVVLVFTINCVILIVMNSFNKCSNLYKLGIRYYYLFTTFWSWRLVVLFWTTTLNYTK